MTNACLSEDDRATRRVIDATSEREMALALQNVSTTSAPLSHANRLAEPKTRRPAPNTHRPDVTRTAERPRIIIIIVLLAILGYRYRGRLSR
jgi:hypothetical protein